jgi:hypothetical protein
MQSACNVAGWIRNWLPLMATGGTLVPDQAEEQHKAPSTQHKATILYHHSARQKRAASTLQASAVLLSSHCCTVGRVSSELWHIRVTSHASANTMASAITRVTILVVMSPWIHAYTSRYIPSAVRRAITRRPALKMGLSVTAEDSPAHAELQSSVWLLARQHVQQQVSTHTHIHIHVAMVRFPREGQYHRSPCSTHSHRSAASQPAWVMKTTPPTSATPGNRACCGPHAIHKQLCSCLTTQTVLHTRSNTANGRQTCVRMHTSHILTVDHSAALQQALQVLQAAELTKVTVEAPGTNT